MRFVDQFSVVLLDMNGTFMFGHDQLSPGEDFYETYQAAGGLALDRARVTKFINSAVAALAEAYGNPAREDDFPAVSEIFNALGIDLQQGELSILEDVIALHELVCVSAQHERFLRDIAATHSLGVVSNLWSRAGRWRSTLRSSDLLKLFRILVFSSDGRSVKPSKNLFHEALAAFPSDARVLFVGDSIDRDIAPAKALGLSTAWIAPHGSQSSWADIVVDDLTDLGTAQTRSRQSGVEPERLTWAENSLSRAPAATREKP